MNASLRSALLSLWLLIVLVCLAVAFLMAGLFEMGVGGEVKRVQNQVDSASESIARHFRDYASKADVANEISREGERERVLAVLADLVLNDYAGVEGGFWDEQSGFVAYSFPTHEGDTPKRDVPEAEKERIISICRAALDAKGPQTRRYEGSLESLILAARPVTPPGENGDRMVVWSMSRAHVRTAAAYQRLTAGFAVVLSFALISGAGLLWFLQRWSHRVNVLEDTIVRAREDELPTLPLTGQKELDRIVEALNHANSRLKEARLQAGKLASDLARSQRHAALGRMAAELVHDIRNPIGAMRLRAENALVKGGEQQAAALSFILAEIVRLEDVLQRLLAVARLQDLACKPVKLDIWLEDRAGRLREQAEPQGIDVRVDALAVEWSLDEKSMSRALDNLLLNAWQHTSAGGRIELSAVANGSRCSISVENTGPAIPVDRREKIFEIYSTDRDGGTGLGLGIAREIVEAHGGTLQCVDSRFGARFVIELPCARS